MFPENPRKFPDSRTVQTGHPRAPARARARGNLADDLREILAQREAERWILTVRRASEILDVSQLEVANAAWWQGIRWLACRTRPRGSRPLLRCGVGMGEVVARAGGMTEATIHAVCAAALPGRTLTRWSYAA